MKPEDVVPEYFRCIRENDSDGISKFFADDAVKIDWQGERYDGKDALIKYMETGPFQANFEWVLSDGAVHPTEDVDAPITQLRPLPPMWTEDRACVEVRVTRPDGNRYRAIDMFGLNEDGLVSELLVYRGPYGPE